MVGKSKAYLVVMPHQLILIDDKDEPFKGSLFKFRQDTLGAFSPNGILEIPTRESLVERMKYACKL